MTCFSRDVKRKQNKPRSMLYTKHEGWVYIDIYIYNYDCISFTYPIAFSSLTFNHIHTHKSSIFREWPDGKRPYLLGPRRKPCDSKAFPSRKWYVSNELLNLPRDDPTSSCMHICAGVDQLPLLPDNGGWENQPKSRGLYTHYRDSLLKVGWPSPI